MQQPQVVGIVNITTDSFSDGGQFLEAEAAITHARKLIAVGADIIELGAASSNPKSEHVPAEAEIKRLEPVIDALKGSVLISVDTAKPEVQKFALEQGVAFINDVRGFPDASIYPQLAASETKLVVMHSISDSDRAIEVERSVSETFDSISSLFDERVPALTKAGISRERIIIDPGMGFFLASNPEPSFAVLANVEKLKGRYKLPVMISVSRKSFLRNLALSAEDDVRIRTLAAELYAVVQGAGYIRTHEVRVLKQGLLTLAAIRAASSSGQFSR